MSSRENALEALKDLIQSAYPWGANTSRQLVMWTQVPKDTRPAAFVFDAFGDRYEWIQNKTVPKITVTVLFVVYITGQSTPIGSTQISEIMTAMNLALQPKGTDLALGRNTLGGNAYSCRFDGVIKVHPGDIDSDGLIWGPIKIVLPF